MASLSTHQLDESLAGGLHSAYLLHGEEDLLRVEALDALRSAAKQHGYDNREVFTVDNGFDWSALMGAAQSAGLFADKKLLEIHIPNGKPGKEGGEALVQLAHRLPEDTCVVLVLPKLEKAQAQSKWFGAWAKVATVVEAKAVSLAALPQWIETRLARDGLAIESDALRLFADKVEGNLLAAKQEIDKLALLLPAGHLVSVADAEAAVANVARFDVFQLAAAWMNGDAARVVRLLDGLAAEGSEPVLLLWAISEDIRTLIRLLAALKQGQNVGQLRNSLRLWGEKQTWAPQAARRIGVPRLLLALQTCARIDRQIKGAEEGDAWAETRHLLLSLAA
ncbi:DNA polymerase III subunit delta [Snodgrassella sp. CFCC 13594]|uniref:DNA polymerase III subunit delta n=1 Tax=Snodgrassella sp. CFCC 13594 TaxID=1775559 RepID=UPI000836C160|nr:DNA polymerase III subunit delta [Snodgrassella sp. CFCC 13594]